MPDPMSPQDTVNTTALALTGAFVVAVLLYGYFVIQQIALSVIIALVGVLAYLAWRLLRGRGPNRGDESAA